MTELSPKMVRVLRVLDELRQRDSYYDYPATPNAIGYLMGYRPGRPTGRLARSPAPATRVTTALTALRRRGLVDFGYRPDGLSGTAYRLTKAGQEALLWYADD